MSPVATGKWGCGIFGGDAQLKTLLQIMACAVTQRDVVFFTHGGKNLGNQIFDMYKFLVQHGISVCKYKVNKKKVMKKINPTFFFH